MTALDTGADVLPATEGLSQAQRRGVHCVFCAVALSARTAVDLGPRPLPDTGTAWFPRRCTTCPKEATPCPH